MTLSLLAEYDDLMRINNVLANDACEPEFLRYVLHIEETRLETVKAKKECERLMKALQEANAAKSDLERKLNSARQMVDLEKKKHKAIEAKFRELGRQMDRVHKLVWDGRNKLHEETWQQLASVCSRSSPAAKRNSGFRESAERASFLRESVDLDLYPISEGLDSTGSLLSELGYTQSEDEVEISFNRKKSAQKSRRTPIVDIGPDAKRLCSAHTPGKSEVKSVELEARDRIVATTKITVSREGPIVAKTSLEADEREKRTLSNRNTPRQPLVNLQPSAVGQQSVPKHPTSTSESEESMICTKECQYPSPTPCNSGLNLMARDRIIGRSHTFCQKTMIMSEMCDPCGKRIRFGKVASKCRDCRATVHPECKERLPLPCVPVNSTPTGRGPVLGVISDFTPTQPPMVPAILLHCINEVEARGLTECGIYRVSGSERDVKNLKERFLRGKGAPQLGSVDIHVVCSVIKDFLRSLREPLVMPSMWADFIRCVDPVEEHDQQARLYQVVAELPRPNRDTLAYLILHLQRVSECPACRMSASNLAKVFGPTLVGYSTPNPDPTVMIQETMKQVAVVELMMKAPSSYWSCFVNVSSNAENNHTPEPVVTQPRNPSSSSLQKTGFFSTPLGTVRSFKAKQKFFSQC